MLRAASLLKEAREQITQLKAHVAELEAGRVDGDRFKPTDKAEHIAAVRSSRPSRRKYPNEKAATERKGGQYARA